MRPASGGSAESAARPVEQAYPGRPIPAKAGFLLTGIVDSMQIGIGEGPGDGVEIDDVADHEPVVPGARLQATPPERLPQVLPEPSPTEGSSASLRRSISSSSPEPGSCSTRRAYLGLAASASRTL